MRLFRAIPPGFKLQLFTYIPPLLVIGISASQLSCVAQQAADDSAEPPTPPSLPALFQLRPVLLSLIGISMSKARQRL